MFSITTEKGVFVGESPYMIFSTIEAMNSLPSEGYERGQAEDFLLSQRIEIGEIGISRPKE